MNSGDLVEVPVVQRVQDLIDEPFQLVKVHYHTNRIQSFGLNRHFDAPVMPVSWLE